MPQELIDHIIDYLRGDPLTLCSCALVARGWTASARHHQFHKRLIAEDKLDFYTQLVTTRPQIAACIQEFCLFTRSRTASRDTESRVFVAFLNQLPLLHTLKLWGVVFVPQRPADGHPTHYTGTRLRRLELDALQITTEDFLDTLALFSHSQIGHLRIQSCVVFHTSDDAHRYTLPSVLQVPLRAETLQIALGSHDFLLALLARVLDPNTLHSLDCGGDFVSQTSRPAMDAFLEKFGPPLEHLRWDVCSLYLLSPDGALASSSHDNQKY